MSGVALEVSPAASSDPLEVVEVGALNEAEAGYVRAARAANTLRGYRSDWAEWCAWSKSEGYPELPATFPTVRTALGGLCVLALLTVRSL